MGDAAHQIRRWAALSRRRRGRLGRERLGLTVAGQLAVVSLLHSAAASASLIGTTRIIRKRRTPVILARCPEPVRDNVHGFPGVGTVISSALSHFRW
jgi:hypothetical protein